MKNIGESSEYTLDRLTEKNLRDVEKLHTAVYGHTPAAGHYQKKYDTAFTGISYTGFIAYNKQHLPVSYYGVIPCFLQLEDGIVLAAQSADTMTHPDHRHRGLFVQLADLTYDLCKSVGIKMIFGFPNQNSFPGLLNLNWIITDTMDRFVIPVSNVSLGKVAMKFPVLTHALQHRQESILQKFVSGKIGLPNSAIDERFSGVLRDHHFLKYKTYAQTMVIKASRSLVWVKVSNNLVIGDILIEPGDFDELMAALIKIAKKLWVKEVQFHASQGTTLHKLFAEHYTAIPSFQVMFKILDKDLQPGKVKFTFADIDIF